jgi:hypothetical protein
MKSIGRLGRGIKNAEEVEIRGKLMVGAKRSRNLSRNKRRKLSSSF